MSLAGASNAIIPGTLFNDLVLYHKNPANQVVVGIYGSSNALVVSASNIVAKGPLECPAGVSPSAAYPYGVFVSAVGGGGGGDAFAGLAGALETARHGVALVGSNVAVPAPGVYFCTLDYGGAGQGRVVVAADGQEPEAVDYGQAVVAGPGGATARTTMVVNVSSAITLHADFVTTGPITLALRRLF